MNVSPYLVSRAGPSASIRQGSAGQRPAALRAHLKCDQVGNYEVHRRGLTGLGRKYGHFLLAASRSVPYIEPQQVRNFDTSRVVDPLADLSKPLVSQDARDFLTSLYTILRKAIDEAGGMRLPIAA
jgi:hypothetical protein